MDGRNNQFNPQNTRNRQVSNTIPSELNHILQHGVTPEQFAENARQLETYSRINAAALQVHLQRQSQQADQRRQDELRLIQMAHQLASGPGSQQQLPRQLPPPAPPIPHNYHSSFPQAIASRNPAVPYNKVSTNNVASQRWSHVRQPPASNIQHHPSVNRSAPFVNPNGYPSLQTHRVSQPTGESSVLAASNTQASQPVQLPTPAPFPVFQYTQQFDMARDGSHVNTGLDGLSGAITNHNVQQGYGNLDQRYEAWVNAYGTAKAASLAREQMQLWQQQRQTHPTMPISTPSTIAPPTTPISAQGLQNQGQLQIPKQGGTAAASLPLPQTQQWHSSVSVSNAERQAVSQSYSAASSDHAPVLHPPTSDSTIETDGQQRLNTTAAHNGAGVQSHHLGTRTSIPTVTPANVGSTLSALPSSQSVSTQSILLESEEKGASLYTLQGLAASIKRSLNAEKLAAFEEPSPSDRQKRKRSDSVEVTDTRREAESSRPDPNPRETHVHEPPPKAEPQPVNFVTEPDDPPPTMLSVSLPEVSMPQQETAHVPNGFAIPISQHDPPGNFVPFSTLTGAVSMDNVTGSVPTSHNAAYSSEAMGVIEDLTTGQSTPETVLHHHIDVPLVPVSYPPFDHLSFTHRTPSPQLAATITSVRDEDEADEKARTTPSRPSTPLHDESVDSQLQSNPSRSGNDLEMDIASGEDHDQVHFDIMSDYTPHSEARDNNSTIQEPKVFVSRDDLLESPIEGIDRESMGNLGADQHPETRSPEPAQARVLAKTPPTRGQSPGSAETSGPGSLPKPPRKTLRRRDFYVAVPPPSEWVLRAKDGEVERKVLVNEKTGQSSIKEYTDCELATRLCPRRCHWNGCQAVLNSMFSLKQHVRQHQSEVKPVGPAMTVSCQWKQCRMVCEPSSLLVHLNRHIEKEMACIYDDCDERFSRIKDLAEHEKNEHADDEPPPSAVPRPPDLKPPVALPQIVPSYTTTTRLTSKPSITVERHARLGPWTLGMIIGDPSTGLDGDGYNSTLRARRTTRLTDKAYDVVATPTTFPSRIGDGGPNAEFVARSAEYDLLEEPVGSGHSFGDLDTVDVTREFYDDSNVRGGSPWWGMGDDASEETEMEVDRDSLDVEALL